MSTTTHAYLPCDWDILAIEDFTGMCKVDQYKNQSVVGFDPKLNSSESSKQIFAL